MKSLIEEFADINARLKQIERETAQPLVLTSSEIQPDDGDGSAEKTPNGIAWDSVYGFTPGVEDVYCGFKI